MQLTKHGHVGRIEGIFCISGYYARLAYTLVSDQKKLKEEIVRLGHVSVSSLVPRGLPRDEAKGSCLRA